MEEKSINKQVGNKGVKVMVKSKQTQTDVNMVHMTIGNARDNLSCLAGLLAYKQDTEFVVNDAETRELIKKAIKDNITILMASTAKLP